MLRYVSIACLLVVFSSSFAHATGATLYLLSANQAPVSVSSYPTIDECKAALKLVGHVALAGTVPSALVCAPTK
jgi:hypothetical protein